METTNIWEWLIQQAPVIVVMGIVIYWLSKRLVRAEDQKDELSKEVIKLTTIWEEKGKSLGEEDRYTKQEILTILQEIKLLLTQRR